jgi:hypothetical protein
MRGKYCDDCGRRYDDCYCDLDDPDYPDYDFPDPETESNYEFPDPETESNYEFPDPDYAYDNNLNNNKEIHKELFRRNDNGTFENTNRESLFYKTYRSYIEIEKHIISYYCVIIDHCYYDSNNIVYLEVKYVANDKKKIYEESFRIYDNGVFVNTNRNSLFRKSYVSDTEIIDHITIEHNEIIDHRFFETADNKYFVVNYTTNRKIFHKELFHFNDGGAYYMNTLWNTSFAGPYFSLPHIIKDITDLHYIFIDYNFVEFDNKKYLEVKYADSNNNKAIDNNNNDEDSDDDDDNNEDTDNNNDDNNDDNNEVIIVKIIFQRNRISINFENYNYNHNKMWNYHLFRILKIITNNKNIDIDDKIIETNSDDCDVLILIIEDEDIDSETDPN